MDSKQIVKAIESDDWVDLSGTVCGLRVDRAVHVVGDTMPVSREWYDCALTGEVLDGTCAIEVDSETAELAASKMKQYHGMGNTVYLIKSRTAKGGQDIGEVVLVDAVVVAVLGSL